MLQEDLSAFFSDDELAVVATYNGSSINVNFDEAYTEELGVSGNTPVIRGIQSEFNGIAQGETITVNATNYTVDDFQPDGTGLILIVLKAAS